MEERRRASLTLRVSEDNTCLYWDSSLTLEHDQEHQLAEKSIYDLKLHWTKAGSVACLGVLPGILGRLTILRLRKEARPGNP